MLIKISLKYVVWFTLPYVLLKDQRKTDHSAVFVSQAGTDQCFNIAVNVSSIFGTMLTHELPVTKEVNLGPVNIWAKTISYTGFLFAYETLYLKRCSDVI